MKRVLVVAERELRAAFRGPVAYAIAGLYLLLHGVFFAQLLEEFSSSSFNYLTQGQQPDELNLVDMLQRVLIVSDAFLLLFLVPALTMRAMSEEWRQGTSDLLLSYPLREVEIVLGKFAGYTVLVGAIVLLGTIYPAAAALLGRIEWPVLASGVLGLLLFGMAVVAIGIFASTLTENQVVAFGVAWVIAFGMTLLSFWTKRVPEPWDWVLQHLSLTGHVDSFGFGIVRASDAVFFLSLVVFFLFLATGVLESHRWRRGR
jgi:ABC-2 type transport system permease protein